MSKIETAIHQFFENIQYQPLTLLNGLMIN